MKRFPMPFAAIVAIAVLLPSAALATIRPGGVRIRWIGDPPAAARSGVETRGRFEVVAPKAGVLEDVRIEGAGWSGRVLAGATRGVLARGDRRTYEFAATPRAEGEPLAIVVTFDGRTIRQELRLDQAALERARRPGRLVFQDGPPRVAKSGTPRLDDQTIRFRGRVTYQRDPDNAELGADSIQVRIMDDDSPDPFDDVIWQGFTGGDGSFDVTVSWDGDDPDIYIEVVTLNGAMDIHDDTIFQTTYRWSSEDNVIEDYTGNDVQFGTLQPAPGEHGAASVYNAVRRAYRHAWDRAGLAAPPVEVFWPNDNGTFYDLDNAIFIGMDETWNEGTISHEFGHHLHDSFGTVVVDGGDDNYCGTGHCGWCPESVPNAFVEGFAGWFGYTVNAQYVARYGLTPLSINDGRYVYENLGNCCQSGVTPCTPNVPFPGAMTEGYTAALLRDIEDAQNDDHDGGSADCDMDALTLGDDEIYALVMEDDPTNITEFIAAFRLRYNQHDQDFWSTVRNVWTGFGFAVIPPLVTSAPDQKCRVVRAGDAVTLDVLGNGALLQYRWRRDGVDLTDGGGVAGALTKTLTLSPTNLTMNGTYTCRVTTCDGTFSVISLPFEVTILAAPAPRSLVSWGSNASGQVGDGTTVWRVAPTVHENLPNMVSAAGGASFSVALGANGLVYSWGYASGYGELGNGNYNDQKNDPGLVPGITDIVRIASGDVHTLALKRDGTVWGWGFNGFGNLADSTQAARPLPVRATELEGCVQAIACGGQFSLALMADGTVQAWGSNEFGTLGRGTTGGWSVIAQPVPGLSDVEAISACGYLALALKSDGTVWAWGSNHSGALGIGLESWEQSHSAVPVQVTGLPVIRKITAGAYAGFAISNEGAAYGWGSNQYALQGVSIPSLTHRTTAGLVPGLVLPVQIVAGWGGFAAALESNGTVWMWGYNSLWPLGRSWTSDYIQPPQQVEGVVNASTLGTGWSTLHACGALTGVTGAENETLPVALALRAAPNPSLGRTRLAFDLPRDGRVTLAVYDLAGRRVRTLFDGARAAGRHDEVWDGRGEQGAASLAGVYFVRLEANGETRSERVVRIR